MKTEVSLAGGLLSGIGATACCAGPLVLVTLGAGGAWAAGLARLAPLQPVFAGLALAFVGFAFHGLYVKPRQCKPGEACEAPQVLRRRRSVFWAVAALIAAMLVFPLFAEYFY